MSATRKLSRHEAAEFIEGLRRDISAARLRVTLDGKLGRATPPAVKKLASLPEPPVIRDVDDAPGSGATASGTPVMAARLFRSASQGALAWTLPRSDFDELPEGFVFVREDQPAQGLPSESEMK